LLFTGCQTLAKVRRREIKVVELKGKHPGVPAITPDRKYVVSVNQESSNLSFVRLEDFTLDYTINLSGGRQPWEIAFTPDARFGFVAHSGFEDSKTSNSFITVVDTAQKKETARIDVGMRPNGVAVDKSGKLVFVANMGSHSVSVIDANNYSVIKEIPVGRSPFDIGITPDNKTAVVVNFMDSSLSFIDMQSLAVNATLQVGKPEIAQPYEEFGPGDSCQIDIHRENGLAFVSNYRTHQVVVVDTEKREIVKKIDTIRFPFGIQFEEYNNLLTVVSGESRKLGIVELGISEHLIEMYEKNKINPQKILEKAARDKYTQIEAISLGQGNGKQPLGLPKSRANELSIIYVDPIKGYLYNIPPRQDAFFSVSAIATSNAGA